MSTLVTTSFVCTVYIRNVDADLLVSDIAVFVLKRDVIDRVK